MLNYMESQTSFKPMPPLIKLEEYETWDQPLNWGCPLHSEPSNGRHRGVNYDISEGMTNPSSKEEGMSRQMDYSYEYNDHEYAVKDSTVPLSMNKCELPRNMNINNPSNSPINEQLPSTSKETSTRSKKKPQECTFCGNHGIYAPMKGHKHHCTHSDCNCGLCQVTRKKNYYTKMYQKMNRSRHGHMQASRKEYPNEEVQVELPVNKEYPASRLREMTRDLAGAQLNFLDEIKNLTCPKRSNKIQ